MKKIYLLAAAGLMMLSSCDLDINQNPNYPTGADISPELQFPAVISAIADASGDQMFNYGGFFAQYFEQMPEANQYNDIAELNIDESKDVFNRCYNNIYAGALMDIEDIKTKTTNTANLFACQVMRTQAFQLLVDNTSETPYSEALQGGANSSPKYDDGKTVYEGVLAELDAAEAALTGDVMTMTDPLLNKNLSQWKGYANALRLRMYLRLIDGGQSEYTAKVTALLAANNFFSGNVAWDVFMDKEGQYNPWYQSVFSLTSNHCAAYPIVSYMQNMADPRLSYAIKARTSDNTFVGQFPGSKQEPAIVGTSYKNKDVSTINYDVAHDMPIYLFTQSELQFLIAEAQMRFNNNASAAKAAYEAGVEADFALRGVSGAEGFLAAAGSWDNAADKLKLVYMQKWTALFMHDHMEAWSEIRRTDVPALSTASAAQIKANPALYTPGDLICPAVNKKGGNNIAMSMPYSSNSRKYNVNTPATARQITDKVFWDVK
ncbi:Starch-binding associating with outer membrane [Prevotella aff. ruminicola Tc2-24]|uniref:Starch-binding associating with outer membrane n=1 Tax=Prevotella aff. ruminicola Tc2-24 TaxID=81582 RepID=A0A1I0NXM5_9BACT|nr:SusD/RagB family nutrient-binding outer membrane lipoprotein [Prevotella aff. ruminicola Tc2-24]SEW06597.1 Starch-binding associating with outer membrane [Prevotella aff. ruminicola Tc2-24]